MSKNFNKLTEKYCKGCDKVKLKDEFKSRKNYNRIIKVHLCIECDLLDKRRRNSLVSKEKRKEYRQNRKQKNKEYNRKLYLNPEFKLKKLISHSIRQKLMSKKNISSKNYLPYSIKELKEHLEKQFESWMNWNNWGIYDISKWKDDDQSTWTWQIDHIIPHSLFKYSSMQDKEFKECWSLNNLRPISSKENIIKSNKI